MAKRKQYSPELKTRVALAAIRGDGTIAELAQKYSVHPNMIAKWKREAIDGMKDSFNRKGKKKGPGPDNEIRPYRPRLVSWL